MVQTIFEDRADAPVLRAPGRLREWLAAEQDRWILWMPAAFGLGIALYFGCAFEPLFWVGAAATLGAAAALVVARVLALGRAPRILLMVPLLVALGFAAAQIRATAVGAPVLDREIGPLPVEGRVVRVEPLAEGTRVTLDTLAYERRMADAGAVPARARLRLRGREAPDVGALIRIRAVLQPPSGPAAPGAFDFGRQLWFSGIGAVGYALSAPEILAPSHAGWQPSLWAAGLRREIAQRIGEQLGSEDGGLAVALLTGDQTAVPTAALEAMRASGLAHLISISGLHIGLVAGLVFGAVRAMLALNETAALRYPIKKWAAAAGLVAAAGYTVLVGAPVPTLRALLMTGLVLAAVMLDRNPFSMRLVGFAACVVLLLFPEALPGPSFQMSFAAVAALIAAYEVLSPRIAEWRSRLGAVGGAALYLGGVALTSLVAGAATLPFSLFHFQQIQLYGILSNMLAVPLTSFWVMPMGLLVCLALPFGVEGLPLSLMGWGIEAILAVARWTAGLPGAALAVPAMPAWGLCLVGLGLVWLLIWTRRPRLLGLLAIAAGLASPALAERPDLLVGPEGKLVALRGADGQLAFSTAGAERFDGDVWLRRNGQSVARIWPAPGAGARDGIRCDALGCLWAAPDGRTVAIVRSREALAEDCRSAAVVVSLVPPGRACRAPALVDASGPQRDGGIAVYLVPEGVRVETVRAFRGDRPWVPDPRGRGRGSSAE
ncbi:ComEC/Rec2 family competence protein [Arenibaculum pallidiluteum]|uniref:ComEC/Rec2 family competence protein n=1 Tax=Arenibaculum pallidiluteum TaxID=2812559 RepID=UPI001A96D6E8|nr:ComEC/Rec2 family competence protein [Arenibaculum pallidiluteum]